MKKWVILVLAVISVLLLAGCKKSGETEKPLSTGEIAVVRDTEFGNVYIDLTIEEFNALGFAFGDSVDFSFDNGRTFRDIPYYSGYYVPVGSLLACGYPGYPHVVFARNYGSGTWAEFGIEETSRVTVTLNEKGKYAATQELYSLEYSDIRETYPSDIAFANFREVEGGRIRKGLFYRSASPCDDQHKRASYANALAEEYQIRFVLNLPDNETKYRSYVEAEGFSSVYYNELYQNGTVRLLSLNANYRADAFAKTLSEALSDMTGYEGPVLVHCVEGKDRTGFVCALLLALAGASPEEIIDDYMITYANYYGVTREGQPDKYEAVLENVKDFLYFLCDAEKGVSLDTLDLPAGARNYLKKGGLTDGEIRKIEDYVTIPAEG